MTQGIYLDNSATTRPSEQAVSSMYPYLVDMWGSSSAPHQMGQELFPTIQESYQAIYTMLGASENDSFVFTSSGPEGVNQVVQSAWMDISLPTGKNHYITSYIDEAPAIMAIGKLERLGAVGTMVKPDPQGYITKKSIIESITPRTALLSLSWANGLTGVINPVGEIAEICRDRGIKLHLEASHVLGKLFFDIEEVKPDFITFNGDNLHAPKGTGGLYIKKGTDCSPLILGGLEQGGYRAGHVNVPSLTALGCAAKEMTDTRDFMCTEVARLRDILEDGILEALPEAKIFFQDQERIPNVTAIGFPGITNEALLYALNRNGVFASIGGGSFQRIDLILSSSGVDEQLAQSAVSFSLSRETTEEEIENAVSVIADCAKKLRNISGSLIQ